MSATHKPMNSDANLMNAESERVMVIQDHMIEAKHIMSPKSDTVDAKEFQSGIYQQ